MKDKLKALWASFTSWVSSTLQSLKTKLSTDASELWAKDKGFVIAFGIILLIIKFRDILIDLLVASAKAIFTKAQKQSDVLSKQEDQNNAQADQLAQDASDLSNSGTPVNDDWNQK